MKVVILRAAVERNTLAEGPREVIASVALNGLNQAHNNPKMHREDVVSKESRPKDSPKAEEESLNRVSIFSGHAEGG